MFQTNINISGPTPAVGLGPTVVGQQLGLLHNVWVMKVVLVQDAGGPQDVYLQTRDTPTGPWSDIAHFPQLVAGAATLSYRVGFYRGLQSAVAPSVENNADGTPTLAVNTILTWANGLDLRCIVVPGALATGTGSVNITGMAVAG